MPLHLIPLLPVITGLLCLLLPLKAGRMIALAASTLQLLFAAYIFAIVRTGGAVLYSIGGWPSGRGIDLAFDPLSSNLLLLAGVLYFLFSFFVLFEGFINKLFLFLYLTLQGLTAGMFLSADLFNIFVVVEVSTIVVSIMLLYRRDKRSAHDGLLYLMTNITAMTFFVLGVGVLYKQTGELSLYRLKPLIETAPPGTFTLPWALLTTGACLKAAQAPLFSWLPRAHATPGAPTVVSAILSGVYVKGGIYLFIRIRDLFGPGIETGPFFVLLGFVTAISGFVLALRQNDIKRILACSTVSQMGLIMAGLSIGTAHAEAGAILHILNHAVFKSTLFLCAGLIAAEYKTRDIRDIRGVLREMPVIALCLTAAILGIAGAPFFNGSMSKYLIGYGAADDWPEYLLLLVNLGTTLTYLRMGRILFGRRKDSPGAAAGERGCRLCLALQKGVISVLALFCLAGGIWGGPLIVLLFGPELSLASVSWAPKIIVFLATCAAAVLLLRFTPRAVREKSRAIRFDPAFNTTAALILVFMLALIAAARFFTPA